MNPVIILYPVGGGGQWLSNLIYSLNCADFNIVVSSLNFHDSTWAKTNLVSVRHWSNNVGPSEDPHTYDSFCGPKSSFISFINACVKLWPYHNLFISLPPIEQFFYLTNDAKWRMGSDPIFNNLYLNCVSLNSDLLFTSPRQFAQQLFDLLDQRKIEYTVDIDFVLKSIDNFKSTCQLDLHFGNIQSIAWQAWCHALVLEYNIPLDLSISDDFNGFLKFIDHNNTLFKSITQEHFLTKVQE
jgi:hypothetical protein